MCTLHCMAAGQLNSTPVITSIRSYYSGALVDSKGCRFESRSSRHIGTLGKSFSHSCLWRFNVKLRHSIRAVLGALLSSIGFEEAL